jgi:membrane fusion protein (multidrug efflux system)
MSHRISFYAVATCVLLPALLPAQKIELAPVTSQRVSRTVELPGEIYAYESVQLHAKVPSYVERIYVDRSSVVKKGDLLVQLSAPEMAAHIAQARAQLTAAQAAEAETEAQLQATRSTYEHTQEAAKTPGVIAGNDLVQAEKQTEAARSLVEARQRSVDSAKANLRALQDLAGYLQVTAPFDGVITTRFVHPGALVGPGSDSPLLQLDQISRLRVTVAVPEADVGGIAKGVSVHFSVPAYPGRTFSGTVARPAAALDQKTRTMPVEVDFSNPEHLIFPGMYPSVLWPVRERRPALLVPVSSIVTTTERVFVIRDNRGRAQWVNVRRGASMGDNVEVYGDLKPGDEVVRQGTDEIRDGSPLR